MAVLEAAHGLGLPRLAALAEALLLRVVDDDNVFGLLAFADTFAEAAAEGPEAEEVAAEREVAGRVVEVEGAPFCGEPLLLLSTPPEFA
jgi:hypothetical protein